MKKNSKSKTSTVTHDHPGRPRYTMKFPTRKEWTFTNLMEVNGVETNPKSKRFGKGDNCTMLTLRKNMEADMYLHKPGKPLISKNRTRVNPRSQVCLIDGVTAEPDSESGLGRRALLYCLRVNKDNVSKPVAKTSTPKATTAKAPRKARTPKSTSQTPTADALDKIHAALAAPDPSPAVTVPAVAITPEVTPAPAPEVAPVAETAPAPEPVAEVAPTAPVSTLVNS